MFSCSSTMEDCYLKIFLCDGTGPTFLLNKVGTFEIALKTLLGSGVELIMLK